MDSSIPLVPPLQCCKSENLPQGLSSIPTIEDFNHLLNSPTFATHHLITRSLFSELLSVIQHRGLPNANHKAQINLPSELDLSKFHLSPRPAALLGKNIPLCHDSQTQSLLMYEGRIVAVDDLLYDILCFCHLACGHGDQQTTNVLVQENYAFVPVDLVAQFVKACPGCPEKLIAGKAGDVTTDSSAGQSSIQILQPIIRCHTFLTQDSDITLADPSDVVEEGEMEDGEDFVRYLHFERTLRSAISKIELPLMSTKSAPGVERPAPSMTGSMERLMSLPMSREVSLYQGIPNGWQYHFPDYESALNEFVKQKDEPAPETVIKKEIQNVPRIPSVAPLSRDRIKNTIGNGTGDGSELFERRPVVSAIPLQVTRLVV